MDDNGTGECGPTSPVALQHVLCAADAACAPGGVCLKVDDPFEACVGDDVCLPTDTNGDGVTDVGVDEDDERCPFGQKIFGSDDTCGGGDVNVVGTASFTAGDLSWAYTLFTDPVVLGGDNDGLPDDFERVHMKVTVRNMTATPMSEVVLTLSTDDPTISCVTDNTAAIAGTIPPLGFATTGADDFEFIVGNVNRVNLNEDKRATFHLAARGKLLGSGVTVTRFFGTLEPQSDVTDLDLDPNVGNPSTLGATSRKTIIFNMSGSTACNATRECYNLTANDPNNFYSKWAASAVPAGYDNHCQYNDPTNRFGAGAAVPAACYVSQATGKIVVDNDRDGTTDPGNTDWHIHRTQSRPTGAGVNIARSHDNAGGAGLINSGSLHMGFHDINGAVAPNQNTDGSGNVQPYNPALGLDFETYHMGNVQQIYYRTPFRIGLGRGTDYPGGSGNDETFPSLSFWQQMHLADDALVSGLTAQDAVDAGAVYVLRDRNNDGTPTVGANNDGDWVRLRAYYGRPTQIVTTTASCRYDTDDDGNQEQDIFPGETALGPSSTCSRQSNWACVGDTQDPPFNGGFGQIASGPRCFPEGAGRANGVGIDENGDGTVNERDSGIASCIAANCEGPGQWMEAKVDLSPFRGWPVFIRFVSSGMQDDDNWLLWPTPTANRDDGWYIDDLVVTGLQNAGSTFVLKADTDAPPANVCPADNCPTNPAPSLYIGTSLVRSNTTDDDLDGLVDETDETKPTTTPTSTAAPGLAVDLDASRTTVATCVSGVLQYRFQADSLGDGVVDYDVTPFITTPYAVDSPTVSTRYLVTARCSTDTTCLQSTSAIVCVNGGPGLAAPSLVVTTTEVSWTPATPGVTYDVLRGSLSALHSGGVAAGLQGLPVADRCMGNDVAGPGLTEVLVPANGNGFFYLVRTTMCGGSYNDGTQTGNRDTAAAGVAGVCP